MRQRHIVLLIAAIGLTGIACSGDGPSSPSTTGSIVGSVDDDVFNPVEGATVRLRSRGSSSNLRSDVTDANGGFSFANVEPGDYTWSAACVEDRTEFDVEYPAEDYPDESLRCGTEDVEFETILVKCRPNVLVNASPSYGLQAHE